MGRRLRRKERAENDEGGGQRGTKKKSEIETRKEADLKPKGKREPEERIYWRIQGHKPLGQKPTGQKDTMEGKFLALFCCF